MEVLLTGGNGFLGAHCVATLLQRGHHVVFTTRSKAKGDTLLSRFPDVSADKLRYVVVSDFTKEDAFDDAVKSVPPLEAVIHTAAPYHFRFTNAQEMLDPNIKGTMNLLSAIKRHASTVKHVSMTSSFAAMVNVKAHTKVYDETCWNPASMDALSHVDKPTIWRSSKTFAERTAWKFIEEEIPAFSLSTVNPPIMYGPVLNLDDIAQMNQSNLRISDLLQGKMKDKLSLTAIVIWVDVRDVALAHVRAIEEYEAAAGRRFLLTAGFYSNADIVDVMKKNFPALTDQLPSTYESDLDLDNKPFEIDNRPSKEVLGLRYRSLEESVVDAVKSFQSILS